MNAEIDRASIILVVEDVEETRDGIEQLLRADGYHIHAARDEQEAIVKARRDHPNLILIALGGSPVDVAAIAQRIREEAGLMEVPVVFFCLPTIVEGAEVAIGRNVYVTRPDNFNQLRDFLRRLLRIGLLPN